MSTYCYDIESFSNFFSASFLDIDTGGGIFQYYIFKDRNDTQEILNLVNHDSVQLIGFNSISYDDPMLEYLFQNQSEPNLTHKLWDFGKSLIGDSNRQNKEAKQYRYNRCLKFSQLDLMKIMAFDKLGVGLKQVGINLKWHKIQDLPLPYDHVIKDKEVKTVLEYNLNDVYITRELYKKIYSKISLRKDVSNVYGVDVTNASDSKMANIIFEKYYTEKTGKSIAEIKDLRTRRQVIDVKDCIGKNISFKTVALNNLLKELSEMTLSSRNNFKYSKVLEFGGTSYTMGVGGFHSNETPERYISDDNHIIRDGDVTSFYPNIIIKNQIKPAHLENTFCDVLATLTEDRISAKKSGDKVKADALKITVNSTFGKLGSDTFWMYDPKAMISVTISGQLYILMLIESLNLAGIKVISANTDGVVSYFSKDKENSYLKVCSEWQKQTEYELEFTDYALYFRTDVNNYLCKTTSGKIKEKGRYLREVELNKGYSHPIIKSAMYEYAINNVDVKEYLRNSKDILGFCITQKTTNDFSYEYHLPDGKIINLQKNNRFYISKGGGKIIKRNKKTNGTLGLYVQNNVRILNDYNPEIPFETYDIDYQFYEDECFKYLNDIRNGQLPDDFVFLDSVSVVTNTNGFENPDEEKLATQLGNIKGLGTKVLSSINRLEKEFSGNDFIDFLVYAIENGLFSAKLSGLIKSGFYSRFGGNKKLDLFFQEFYAGKHKYTSNLSAKSKRERLAILRQFVWDKIPDENYLIREQLKLDLELYGKPTTKFPIDATVAFVESIDMKYSPVIYVYSLNKGTEAFLKIQKKIFIQNPLNVGDIIYCKKFDKQNKKKFVDGEFLPIENEFEFWLMNYKVLSDDDLVKLLDKYSKK